MISIYEFCDTFPPVLDGVGRVVLRYCSLLGARGYQMTYCGPRAKQLTGELPDRYILCRGMPVIRHPYKLALPFTDVSFRKQLLAGWPDIIHVHSPFTMGHVALKQARERNIPLVASFHTKYTYDINRMTRNRIVYDRIMNGIIQFYNQAQEVWCPNKSTVEYLINQGYNGEPYVMEHGTDVEVVNRESSDSLKKRISYSENKLNLVYVGQIDRKKGLGRVFEICRYLKEYQVDYCLRIAGQGCDELWARRMAGRLEIEEKVFFLGFLSNRQEIYALYQLSDLLVLPSLYDTFSITMREAAAMGTPTIMAAGSAMSESVTDSYNGIICEDQARVMAEKIIRLMPELKHIGRNAADTLPVSWEEIINRVEDRYKYIIKHR